MFETNFGQFIKKCEIIISKYLYYFNRLSKTQILSNEVKSPLACRCRDLPTGHSV